MTVASERELTSIGILASQVQRPVQAVVEMAKAIGAEAAFTINGTIYFDRQGVQRITEAVSNERSK